MHSDAVADILKKGGIVVMPTDTIYGVLGSALNRQTVERIYKIRKRNPKKPFIVLIPSIQDLKKFGVRLDKKSHKILQKFWPGKISVVLKSKSRKMSYLHRGTNSLAFRIPKNGLLLNLIKKTGPLVAPSANPEGSYPAKNILEAKNYFGDSVDFYVGGRAGNKKPSTLISLHNGETRILRKGADYEKVLKYVKKKHV